MKRSRSATRIAIALDEELAEQTLANTSERERSVTGHPALEDWTPEVDGLTKLLDGQDELIATVAKLGGAKASRPRPARRPRTALDLVKARQRMERHYSLEAEVKEAQQRFIEAQEAQQRFIEAR